MASVPDVETMKTINEIVRAYRQQMRDTGRQPTLEELAQKLDIPLEVVSSAMDIATTPITVRIP